MNALRAGSKGLALVGNRRQGPLANDERARDVDEADRLCARECLSLANPGRGSGAKQTHKAGGGSNRRGREKRRGRMAAGTGNPAVTTLPVDVAMRERQPQGRSLGVKSARAGEETEGLWRGAAVEEDEPARANGPGTASGKNRQVPSETTRARRGWGTR
jgi:hypothetical protein